MRLFAAMLARIVRPLAAPLVVVCLTFLLAFPARPFNSVIAASSSETPSRAPSTFYVAIDGRDSRDGKTEATSLATFAEACRRAIAGDTVVVLDGTYREELVPPVGKGGTAEQPIAFKARNDGRAILAGGIRLRANSFLTFEGFTVRAVTPLMVVSDRTVGPTHVSHHNTFRRMGFMSTSATVHPEGTIVVGDGSHHNLFEDIWVWGAGRYKILFYGGNGGGDTPNLTADYNTIRRAVVRYDPHVATGGNPQADIGFYYASHNIAENVLVIDGLQGGDSSRAGVYITCGSSFGTTECSYNRVLGSVILNNRGIGWAVDVVESGTGQLNEIRNSVVWASDGGAGTSVYASEIARAPHNVVQHCTLASGNRGMWNGGADLGFYDNLVMNNADVGFALSMSRGSVGRFDHNQYWRNRAGPANNISLARTDLQADPRVRYILRIEKGTPGKGSANDGGDRGANVVERYRDGVETQEALWPWPYEARIRTEMCSEETRGWCATPKTLSDYIWTYLGGPAPYARQEGSRHEDNPVGVFDLYREKQRP